MQSIFNDSVSEIASVMPSNIKKTFVATATALGLTLLSGGEPALALNDGVAKLPVMGFNTWNAYQCNINENLVLTAAERMVSLGLKDAGYTHVNIDDCYAEKNRSASGAIIPDPVKFPSGFNNLTNQIHALGMKAGIYSDSGTNTCAGYPGSFQHELQDATAFQNWGFDYLKYDNCYIPPTSVLEENIMGKYELMANAIQQLAKSSGKPPMIYSLCEWGQSQVWLWGKNLGQSWRITDDVQAHWSSVASIINFHSFITMAADFYGHNDLDMLEIGNGNLTHEESKTHFTAWALAKSPLLIGTNLSAISQDNLNILLNKEIIAINQDPQVGTSIAPFKWGVNPDWTFDSLHPAGYWSGQVQGGGVVIMLINTLNNPADMTFTLTDSPWIRAGRNYSVRDLWTHTDNGTVTDTFTAHAVPAHGVVALLMKDAGSAN